MIKLELYELEPKEIYVDDGWQEGIQRIPPKRQNQSSKTAVKTELTQEDHYRIVEMAWQDRTHFDAIYAQFGLSENEVKKLMRKLLSPSVFKQWRKRVQGRSTKHVKKCMHTPRRFEGPW
ncbi:MAG: TIGR03643 family protein [Campylobacterales bacterium]|nr:TIGR03643 family protein [Campylobacterales bacterium]